MSLVLFGLLTGKSDRIDKFPFHLTTVGPNPETLSHDPNKREPLGQGRTLVEVSMRRQTVYLIRGNS